MKVGATDQVVRFISSQRFDSLPRPVIEHAKALVTDGMGCAVFGSTVDFCKQLNSVVERLDPGGSASILGTPARTSPYLAVLANGMQLHALELDDVGVYNHPGSAIIPAALATAELVGGVTGQDFLTSVVAAYEVVTRVAESTGLEPESEIGWHTPGFHGSIAGAVAAAKILNLSGDQMMHTLGMAADMAGGGLMAARIAAAASKKLHSGKGAATGLLSALLAQQGVTGIPDVLEFEPWGYCWALTGYRGHGQRGWDLDQITRNLGDDFTFVDRVTLKYFPAIGHSQTVLDNINALKKEHSFDPGEVEEVTIKMAEFHWRSRVARPIDDLTSANFSPRYAAALGLLHDLPPLYESGASLDLWVEGVKDERVHQLIARVQEVVDTELNQSNPYSIDTTVEIRLRDGRSLARATDYENNVPSPGTKRLRAMDPDDVVAKFQHMVRKVFDAKITDRACELLRGLEDLDDVATLVQELTVEPRD